ncbi:hypothetical protein BGW39_011550 [Mortierella sp. 14UC]|nr:hypothetical protein BGW39_011550 [Mortierella sp. 14UC]
MSLSFPIIPQISIFDIPHILDLICDDLSKDQLLACLDVSRTWRVLFTPHALRYVCFSNLKSHQTWTILNRASLIRSLTIDISDAGWFLNNPTVVVPSLNNLRELHCVDFNYRPKPRAAGPYFFTRPSIVDQSENALLLIASSPKLHTLTIDNISRQYRTDHFTEAVLKSIYTHSSLTNIKIRLSSAPHEFSLILFNSLPEGLQDFELSQLERLVLGEWCSIPTPASETEPLIIDQVIPIPIDESWVGYYPTAAITIDTVKAYAERASGLRHLVIRQFGSLWTSLFQLLLDNCPDLEIIDLSGGSYNNTIDPNDASVQLRGSFVALREFRLSGIMSDQTFTIVSKMLVQSSATLEVLWVNRWNYGRSAEMISNPFHIGTTTSWTQCKRLKELGLYQNGGVFLSDPCWEIYSRSSTFEAAKNHGTVFGQLEKLRLSVKEPLWWECPDQHNVGGGGNAGYDSWYEYDYEEYYYGHFDEKDDEDWKPLKDVVRKSKEEKIREREKQQAERSHQRAFILQVRELFGRLKDLKQLRELEIEWVACSTIRDMSLERALELFKETEAKEHGSSSGQGDATNNTFRTSKGWWGGVTRDDLVWLCLPWSPQPVIQSSGIPSELIKAAARQYENKSQLPGCCDDTNNRCKYDPQPWSTGDIYRTRVGRAWKDWLEVSTGNHPYGVVPLSVTYPYWNHWYIHSDYTWRDFRQTMHSRDFEIFVEGDAENREEALWGRKKATRGEGGRYRQKAVSSGTRYAKEWRC